MKINEITIDPQNPDAQQEFGDEINDYGSYAKRFINVVAPVLRAECSEIIKIYQSSSNPLYRGVKGATGMDFVAGIRSDRLPVQLAPEIHRAAIQAITNLGGVAHRGNSIFTSNSLDVARCWAQNTYIVFPKNGWHTTYYAKMKGYSPYIYAKIYNAPHGMRSGNVKVPPEETAEYCQQQFVDNGISFNKAELVPFLKSGEVEVLFSGEYYYGIMACDLVFDLLDQELGIFAENH